MPGRSTAHHSVAKATNGLFIHWQHVNVEETLIYSLYVFQNLVGAEPLHNPNHTFKSHRLMLEGMIMNNVTQILPRVLYQEGYWQFLQYFTNR